MKKLLILLVLLAGCQPPLDATAKAVIKVDNEVITDYDSFEYREGMLVVYKKYTTHYYGDFEVIYAR